MIKEVIDSLKPLSYRQKKAFYNLVWSDRKLRKRLIKELKKEEDNK